MHLSIDAVREDTLAISGAVKDGENVNTDFVMAIDDDIRKTRDHDLARSGRSTRPTRCRKDFQPINGAEDALHDRARAASGLSSAM